MRPDTPRCPECGNQIKRGWGFIRDDAGRRWHHWCARKTLAGLLRETEEDSEQV